MSAGNLLVRDGRLLAVIDFGCAAMGDPACDLAIAWTLFAGESRALFRRVLRPGRAAWARGRGWALWKALIICAGHLPGEAGRKEEATATLERILMDWKEECARSRSESPRGIPYRAPGEAWR